MFPYPSTSPSSSSYDSSPLHSVLATPPYGQGAPSNYATPTSGAHSTHPAHGQNHASSSPDDIYPQFHAAAFAAAAAASFQHTNLKMKKKVHRKPKLGPDGVPLKRKSREGTTTYLWEFLLKLLQVKIRLFSGTLFINLKWTDCIFCFVITRQCIYLPIGLDNVCNLDVIL